MPRLPGEGRGQCVDGGGMIETCLAHLRAGLADGTLTCERRDVAAILIAANYPLEAGEFLPPLDEAIAKDDRAALNLYARHCLAKHDKEKKGGWLEQGVGDFVAGKSKPGTPGARP